MYVRLHYMWYYITHLNIYFKIRKLRNNMIELTCKKCDDTTIMCDEDVTSVTCSMCVMIDVEVCNG